jgi:hypothetical protein
VQKREQEWGQPVVQQEWGQAVVQQGQGRAYGKRARPTTALARDPCEAVRLTSAAMSTAIMSTARISSLGGKSRKVVVGG